MRGAEMRLDGKLQDGDVGGGVGQDQGDPGAVVEAAVMVEGCGRADGCEQVRDPDSEVRSTRGWVLEFKKGTREAVEIVDGLVGRDSVQGRGCRLPMGGDDQNRCRARRQRGAEAGEKISGGRVLQCRHRGAVAQE